VACDPHEVVARFDFGFVVVRSCTPGGWLPVVLRDFLGWPKLPVARGRFWDGTDCVYIHCFGAGAIRMSVYRHVSGAGLFKGFHVFYDGCNLHEV
jgi:hypothetical protein